ncbi:MAG: ATP-dependent helicase [Candidatus Micrarchaeota archaeon]|nr:ATP-dependent helicase [Candidatus Micrarchaeota archaeon]
MIEYYKKPFSKEESLGALNFYIRDWFEKRYKNPTPPQLYSFKLIREKRNLLITAPTGSGKTFSAFMTILSDLMDMAEAGTLEDKIYCVYISPLRALNNDIFRNLNEPLDEIYKKLGESVKRISVAIRTGDTPQSERQKMLRNPPNILVTTPESLAILLNAQKFSENLKSVRYVVIDEIHELANNKRGVHLSLSLERLTDLVGSDFTRVGLGATLFPLETAAGFLVGYGDSGKERDCYIIDATWDKKMDYQTMCPVGDIVNASDKKIDESIYKTLNSIIKRNRTTLIFTNTRSGTERVVYNLMRRFKYGEEHVAAHHGSLSRESRLDVEEMLKKGKLKCVVSSTSLELGIDIGSIDDVVQLGSPKSVTRAIQRIGRSGHRFSDTAKGEIVAINRDDLVECAVMLDSAKKRRLDSFTIPRNALDVLAQHIVGMALMKKWKIDDAFALVRRAYSYHSLDKKDFMMLIEYLSGSYVGLESRRVYAKIWYDANEGMIGKRGRLTKLIYFLNIGTIPDEVSVNVYGEHNKWIGSIQEEFLSRLKPGDIFVLGGRLYRFDHSREMKAYVTRADTKIPTIPPWFSETLPLTYELALEIGRFRHELAEAIGKELRGAKGITALLKKHKFTGGKAAEEMLDAMPMDKNTKSSIASYFTEQLLFAKHVPDDRHLLIEKTTDESGEKSYLIFHSLYGRRVNDALSRLFAIEASDMFETDVGMMINDNGFVIVTDAALKMRREDISQLVSNVASSDAVRIIRANVRRTEMMKRRFRHAAVRAFMVLRNYKGRQISVKRQQINSELVMKAAEEISPDFPVLKETYREIMEDVMDLPRARELLKKIKEGEVEYTIIETQFPSPFSHVMVTFGEADVVMMKDRRAHLRELHKHVMQQIGKRYG